MEKFRHSRSKVMLVNSVLKICSKFTGEHPCRSEISIKLLCSFIEITLRRGCSPITLLHIFRTPFIKNTSGWLLLRGFNILSISIFPATLKLPRWCSNYRGHSYSMYAKCFQKQTFLTPWYVHVHVHIKGEGMLEFCRCCVRTKWMTP